jgi:hypothetical protein
MSLLQLPFWRANGLEYVLEWHENVGIVKRLSKKISEEKALAYSFFFHFLNGGLAAAAYNIFLNFFELLNVFWTFFARLPIWHISMGFHSSANPQTINGTAYFRPSAWSRSHSPERNVTHALRSYCNSRYTLFIDYDPVVSRMR